MLVKRLRRTILRQGFGLAGMQVVPPMGGVWKWLREARATRSDESRRGVTFTRRRRDGRPIGPVTVFRDDVERVCGTPARESKKSSDARHRGTPTCRRDPAPACAPDSARDRDWRGACAVLKARPADSAWRTVRRAGSAGALSMRRAELVRRGSCGGGREADGDNKMSTPQRGVPLGGLAHLLLFSSQQV